MSDTELPAGTVRVYATSNWTAPNRPLGTKAKPFGLDANVIAPWAEVRSPSASVLSALTNTLAGAVGGAGSVAPAAWVL